MSLLNQPENVLVSDFLSAKISDFGTSRSKGGHDLTMVFKKKVAFIIIFSFSWFEVKERLLGWWHNHLFALSRLRSARHSSAHRKSCVGTFTMRRWQLFIWLKRKYDRKNEIDREIDRDIDRYMY